MENNIKQDNFVTKKVLLCEILLDYNSQQLLKESFDLGDWKVYCEHCTLEFKPKETSDILQFCKENKGKTFKLEVTHIGYSEKAIAVVVKTNAPSVNKVKHITLATNPKGGKPYDSNLIEHWEKLDKNILLSGKIEILYAQSSRPIRESKKIILNSRQFDILKEEIRKQCQTL